MWLPSVDEAVLFPLIANSPGAAKRAFSILTLEHFDGHAARLFDAAQSIQPLENLTPETLSSECARRAEDAAGQSEVETWQECAQIARIDLATVRNVSNPAKEAERIVRKIAKESAPRFTFKTLTQLDAEADPEWLIHGFLTEGGTSLLTAKHGSYKSFFALEMALCVACDFPFHGHEIKAGRVIFIAAEGASGIKKRARAWCQHHNKHPGENFIVLDVPLQIHDEVTRAAFIEAVAEMNPALIVFDTLARCAVGLDENNAGDMGRFADALGALARATRGHVLSVHHNAKGGEYRGSTAIPAAVDTHITLSKGDGKNAPVTLEMPKQKDFEALYPITFEPREVSFTHNGKAASSLIFEKGENPTKNGESASAIECKVFDALESIATDAGVSSSQWKAATESDNISNGAFYKAQKRLVTPTEAGGLGLVRIVSGEHNGRGAKCARYGFQLHNSKVTPNGAMELPDFQSNSTTPQLHSPVGSGVGVELELPVEVKSGMELKVENGVGVTPTLSVGVLESNGSGNDGSKAKGKTARAALPYGTD